MSVDEIVRRADPIGTARGAAVTAPTWLRHFRDICDGRHRRRQRRTVQRAGSAVLVVAAVIAAAVVIARLARWLPAPPVTSPADSAEASTEAAGS
jgi:hypothetical protein